MVGKVKKSKIYLLLLPLLLGGCIKEHLGECPAAADNVRLDFVYTGDGTDDIFSSVVGSVDVYVYNAQGKKVASVVLEKAELEREQGTTMTLAAGEYRVVCWGNVSDNSEISGADDCSTAVLHHPLYVSGGRMSANDPLYYGTCAQLVVPSGGRHAAQTVELRSAHIDLEIFVSGGNISPQFVPVVEVANLYPEYDFEMNPTTASRVSDRNVASYYPPCSYDEGRKAAVAALTTARFASDDPVEIILREGEGTEPMHVVALKDFLSSNGIRVEDMQECLIPVLISFNQDFTVDVTIPAWETPDVKPEL